MGKHSELTAAENTFFGMRREEFWERVVGIEDRGEGKRGRDKCRFGECSLNGLWDGSRLKTLATILIGMKQKSIHFGIDMINMFVHDA
jgi:hypothetical protein